MTAQSVVLRAQIAQDVRTQFGVRVEAAALLQKADALQVERSNARRLAGIDKAADEHEGRLSSETFQQHLALGGRAIVERAAEPGHGRRAPRFAVVASDFGRDGVDRVGVGAHGQHAPVAIDDVAALGIQLDRPVLLPSARATISACLTSCS